MNRHPASSVALAILLLSFGCSDDGSDPPNAPPGNPLEGISLSVGSAVSLGRVEIEGLPTPRGEPSFRLFVLDAGGAELEMPLQRDGDVWFFRAPLHPDQPNEGGVARLVVGDGEIRSPELSLDLEPLPEAPDAYAGVVAALREHVDQRAQWAGTSFDELRAQSFADVDESLLPLKIAQTTIESPDESNDLTDLITNDTGYLTAEGRELLDRICGMSDFASIIRTEIDEFAAHRPARPLERKKTAGDLGRGTCFNTSPEISTAAELSDAMIFSALADLYTDPSGPGGQGLTYIGAAVSLVGTIPGAGGGAAIVGVGLTALQASGQYIGGVYPSAFQSLTYDVDRTNFEEDFPGFAQWENVEVVAVSRGWSADASIANAVISAVGGLLSEAERLQIFESDFLRDMLVNDINLGLGAFLGEFETGIIEFCPDQWTIDITDLPYSTAQALNGLLDVDPATRQVRPLEAGQDFLRVAAQSSQFGGRKIEEDTPMRVHTIVVETIPAIIVVENPGEEVSVTATIQNADLETLLWQAEQGSWTDGILDETNGPTTRPLKTPTSVSAYPFEVYVESLSRQGARASGVPPRYDITTVRLERTGISISPPYECIDNSETLQFEAEVIGVENPEVRWRVHSGWGSINELTGLYTPPPSGRTDDVIIAEVINAEEELSDYASVRVGACLCFYDITIIGDGEWDAAGGDVAHVISAPGGEVLIIQWIFEIGDDPDGNSPGLFGASIANDGESPFPEPGMTGSYPMNVVFSPPSGNGWRAAQDDDDHAGMMLNVTDFTSTFMEGTMTGSAVRRDENGDITSIINVTVSFRSGLFDGSWPCIE